MGRKTKRMAVAGVIVLAAFMAFMSMGAFGANPEAVSVSANLATTLQLSVSKNTVSFGGGSLAPGSTVTDSVVATVNSNKVWSLKVTKSGDLASGGFTVPSTAFTFGATSSDGKVKNLTAAGAQFGTDTPVCSTCDRGSAMPVTVNYSLVVPWDVEPGTYTATHTYTATQP